MTETTRSGLSDNSVAAIAYITFVPAIIFLVLPPYNQRPYVRFHAWQSLILDIVAFFVSFALSFIAAPALMFGAYFFLALTKLLWIAWMLIWVLCAVSALNGKRFKLPLIGSLAAKMAK